MITLFISVVSVEGFGADLGGNAVDVRAPEHFERGEKEDFHVHPKRNVVDVPHVQLELARPRNRVASVHLRPARDAGADFVAARLLRRVKRQILLEQRTRADDRNVPADDVDQLRELVERSRAQKAPDGRDAPFVREQFSVRTALVGHGLEFMEAEDLSVFPGPFLREKHACAFVREMQPDGEAQQQRRKRDRRARGRREIENALEAVAVEFHRRARGFYALMICTTRAMSSSVSAEPDGRQSPRENIFSETPFP